MMLRTVMSRGRKMIMSRRKKIMMLRLMMLRRKIDPKTANHTVCEPALAKCTWTFTRATAHGNLKGKCLGGAP